MLSFGRERHLDVTQDCATPWVALGWAGIRPLVPGRSLNGKSTEDQPRRCDLFLSLEWTTLAVECCPALLRQPRKLGAHIRLESLQRSPTGLGLHPCPHRRAKDAADLNVS